jgi:hypothetical protein
VPEGERPIDEPPGVVRAAVGEPTKHRVELGPRIDGRRTDDAGDTAHR